ncbi:DUF3304 domain-containing protein [Variovorax boronicumulans]|uniref:DUF3304 domain-containing protein n=1 Tax=Variovorax boronicumulans TaxID=436515 RepID=UPI001C55EFA8
MGRSSVMPLSTAIARDHAGARIASLLWRFARRALALLVMSVVTAACTSVESDFSPRADLIGVPVSAVGHYGKMIGIPQFSINGYGGGNSTGWGGGGKSSCCVLLPRNPAKPVMVTVRWRTCDIGHIKFANGRIVNPNDECKAEAHEATVPIHFAVAPGDSSGLFVHFLPGHKVELWMAPGYPWGSAYPGPPYPQDPGPAYAPLPDEKPMPPAAGVR